jgi:Fe-S-cluster containining protein
MKYKKEILNAKERILITKKNFKKIAKLPKKEIDDLFHSEHKKAYQKIDCLVCSNCCKTTSPVFRDIDIKRIAKNLKTNEQQFISQYLKIDDENDFVLKSSPCVFLNENNYCEIYENRPLACKEYPHTNRKNMYQILDLTVKNSLICPAVSKIVEVISIRYEKNS